MNKHEVSYTGRFNDAKGRKHIIACIDTHDGRTVEFIETLSIGDIDCYQGLRYMAAAIAVDIRDEASSDHEAARDRLYEVICEHPGCTFYEHAWSLCQYASDEQREAGEIHVFEVKGGFDEAANNGGDGLNSIMTAVAHSILFKAVEAAYREIYGNDAI